MRVAVVRLDPTLTVSIWEDLHVRYIKLTLLMVAFGTVAALAQSPQTPPSPLSDTRLSVNTLLREDVFAGPGINRGQE